jgi:hemoglobin
VFEQAVDDWPDHLERLTAFWSSALLKSGRYQGRPIPVHLEHRARITRPMLERWLMLWEQTTLEHMPLGAAVSLQSKAPRLAESLELALFFKLP